MVLSQTLMGVEGFDTGEPVPLPDDEIANFTITGSHDANRKQSKSRQLSYLGGIGIFGPNTKVKLDMVLPLHAKILINFKMAFWGQWYKNKVTVSLGDG